nr:helix-turn-helix domain-containing protein [Azoarcus sp. DD4]
MVGVAPFPDKGWESRTWLLEQDGPVTDVETLLARCAYFSPLAEVATAVAAWRDVALAPVVGLSPHELDDLAPANCAFSCSALHWFALHLPGLSLPPVPPSPGGEAMKDEPGQILTLDEVAAYLKVGKRTVYRLAAAKKIPAFKVGGIWRFSRADIDGWIKQQSSGDQQQGGDDLLKGGRRS